VASILKELHPDAYSILARTPVPAHAAGEPSALYQPHPTCGYPVLGHDPVTGELIQVRWNNDDRSVMNNLDPYQVEEWYNAIRTWNKLLTSADSEYWVQLGPGTAVSAYKTIFLPFRLLISCRQSSTTIVSCTVALHLQASAACAAHTSVSTSIVLSSPFWGKSLLSILRVPK
jgi:hypothetical protein